MREIKYPVAKPDLSGNEIEYVNEAVKTGWISSQGKFIKDFENLFAKKHNVKCGIACSSGTNAILLALRALNIGIGDEVIVPDFTMIATAWAVSYTGAKPVFVDCGEDFNIDISKIEEKITEKTKAIIPVHIYGRQCNMEKILEIAKEYNLKIVEDSCEAIGVEPKGDIACFSLYANKIITAGEGGICLTNNENVAWQIEHLKSMSFNINHTFYHPKLGYNFRMTNMQGAVALAQAERLEEFLEKRREIESWYNEGLKNISQIKIQPKRNVLWMYDILVDDREKLIEFLKENGIETRLFFKPMSIQPMYRGCDISKKSLEISKLGLYLPTYTILTEKDVKFICDKIKEFYD